MSLSTEKTSRDIFIFTSRGTGFKLLKFCRYRLVIRFTFGDMLTCSVYGNFSRDKEIKGVMDCIILSYFIIKLTYGSCC